MNLDDWNYLSSTVLLCDKLKFVGCENPNIGKLKIDIYWFLTNTNIYMAIEIAKKPQQYLWCDFTTSMSYVDAELASYYCKVKINQAGDIVINASESALRAENNDLVGIAASKIEKNWLSLQQLFGPAKLLPMQNNLLR